MNKKWLLLILAGIVATLLVISCQNTPEPPVTNIANSNNVIISEALRKFNSKIQNYLTSIAIVYGGATTAYARTTNYEPSGWEHTVVSNAWDKTYGESPRWESHYKKQGENPNDPAFSKSFKLTLFVHEYLHHIELKANVDIEKFFEDVDIWYQNPQWGSHLHNALDINYVKATLFWNLYGGNGGKNGHFYPGQGEFSYIGTQIALGGKSRLSELPPNIIAYYQSILRADLLVP